MTGEAKPAEPAKGGKLDTVSKIAGIVIPLLILFVYWYYMAGIRNDARRLHRKMHGGSFDDVLN